MNFKSYGGRLVVFVVAAVITLIAAGTASAVSDEVTGTERNRIAAAATKATGGGTAQDVERSDDAGEAYEVEVRKPDGTEVDIALDGQLRVLQRENDGLDDDDDDDVPPDNDDNPHVNSSPGVDADDRALTASERTRIKSAAAEALGSGTVTDMEASDDPGTAYEAEVYDRAGAEWDIELDSKFAVVSKSRDS